MLGLGEQDPNFEPHGDLDAERAEYEARVQDAADWYQKVSEQTARRMREFEVRCPVQGCGLAEVVRLPLGDGGARYLFFGYTRKSVIPGFLNWGFSDDWSGPTVWWPVICRHGQAKLERAWLLDCLAFIHGWVGPGQTIDGLRALASANLKRGLDRRVFHPEPAVWRPKGRSGADSM